MDKYPENFNRQTCTDVMAKQQSTLIAETRKSFFEKITDLSIKCIPEMDLEFPDNLWFEHKRTLIGELLLLFGKLKIKIIDHVADVKLSITSIEDVPTNTKIKKIILEFPKY